MAKAKLFEFGGETFHGKTVAEAKATAEQWFKDLAQRTTTSPYYLWTRGWMLIVFPDRYGWSYSILGPAREYAPTQKLSPCLHSNDTLAQAWLHGRNHLAQCCSNPVIGDDAEDLYAEPHVPHFIPTITNAGALSEHRSWCNFQRRYAAFAERFRESRPDCTPEQIRQAFDAEEFGAVRKQFGA